MTVTFARYNTSQAADWSVVVLSEELAGYGKDGAHTSYFDWPDTEDTKFYQEITFENTDWETKSVSGLEVRAGDRIAFGGEYKGGEKTGRGYISDMIVEVLEIVEE